MVAWVTGRLLVPSLGTVTTPPGLRTGSSSAALLQENNHFFEGDTGEPSPVISSDREKVEFRVKIEMPKATIRNMKRCGRGKEVAKADEFCSYFRICGNMSRKYSRQIKLVVICHA